MQYLEVPTRAGEDGVLDKAQIAVSAAEWTVCSNREFLEIVREVVHTEKSAVAQSVKWFNFVKSRTYVRELGDIFTNPELTAKFGGDCDDQTILLLAGFMAIGIPCLAEVITRNIDGENHGVHIRVRAGFPPHDPPKDYSKWNVYDPTEESESAWIGSAPKHKVPKMDTKIFVNGVQQPESLVDTAKRHVPAIVFIVAGIALFAASRKTKGEQDAHS